MKKALVKKAMSVLVVIALMISVMSLAFSSYAVGCNVPVVYVQGQGHWLHDNCQSPDRTTIYPYDVPDGYIVSCVKDALPYLAKAVFLGQWDAYYDVLLSYVNNVFSETVMDNNGNPRNNSGSSFNVSQQLTDYKTVNGEYNLLDYNMAYDWRADPCDTADLLEVYIDNVLKTTGAAQVKLVSRCEGVNIALAYLQEYGISKVDSVVLYCGTMEGLAAVGSLFSGDVTLDSDCVTRYASQALGDDYIMTFIKDTVKLLNETYQLDMGLAAVQKLVLDKIIDNCFDKLIMASYGTMPGYWGMIGERYFNSAKTYLFGENYNNNTQYAGLIQKIDNYHNNVQLKAKDMLKRYHAEGLEVYVISKYGYQNIPINEEAAYPADEFLEITSSSYGASVTKIGTTFSSSYMKNAEKNSTAKYISPEKFIDASTCLFPDSTWFINQLGHKLFPDSVDTMIMTLLGSSSQATVNDYESYPQYMLYNSENDTLTPLTTQNAPETEKVNFFTAFINFIKSFFTLIKTYFSK